MQTMLWRGRYMGKTAGLRGVTARFDRDARRVDVELSSGFTVGIPLRRLSRIAAADDADLEQVDLLGAGNVLHWETLDADYSVPALLVEALGRAKAARELGRLAGRATSEAKTAAARANGRKGGRPRKAG
jgi:hypothetical protein